MLLVDVVFHRLQTRGLCTSVLSDQLPDGNTELEVCQAMRHLCSEITVKHEQQFVDMLNRLHVTPDTLHGHMDSIMQMLFQDQVNWGRIASLFTFSAVLSQHCIEREMPQLVSRVIDWVAEYVDTNVQQWIDLNGGWGGLVTFHKNGSSQFEWSSLKNVCGYAVSAVGAVGMFTLAMMIAPKV